MKSIEPWNAKPDRVSFASDGATGGKIHLLVGGVVCGYIELAPDQIAFLGEACTQWHLINVQIPSGAVSVNALTDGKKRRKRELAEMRKSTTFRPMRRK